MYDTFLHYVSYRLGFAAPETQTSPAEQEALSRHAAGRRGCVEIGVWHGVNTLRIRGVMDPAGVITGVDPFPAGRLGISFPRLVALHEANRTANGTLRLLRMTSREAALTWNGTVDFLFIDGDHTYEGLRIDWESWRERMAPGGIVCLHDSHPTPGRPIHEAGSVRYTDGVILHDSRFELLEVVETLTVLRCRAPEAR